MQPVATAKSSGQLQMAFCPGRAPVPPPPGAGGSGAGRGLTPPTALVTVGGGAGEPRGKPCGESSAFFSLIDKRESFPVTQLWDKVLNISEPSP